MSWKNQKHFCDQCNHTFNLKCFYQIPLTWWNTYTCTTKALVHKWWRKVQIFWGTIPVSLFIPNYLGTYVGKNWGVLFQLNKGLGKKSHSKQLIFWKVAKSEKVFYFNSKTKKKVPNHSPEHYPHKENMFRGEVITIFYWDFSEIEKLSEIKSPLAQFISNS